MELPKSGRRNGHEGNCWREPPGSIARVLLSLLLCALAEAGLSQGSSSAIIGSWRGTSVCTDRDLAPACADEQVVYLFERLPGAAPDKARQKASKIVDGEPVPMGELVFTYDAKMKCWLSEFETPRVRALWSVTVTGDELTGTLALLPSRGVVRRVSAHRER